MELNEMLQERARVYDSLQRLQNQYNDRPMEGTDADTYHNLENRFDELTASIDAARRRQARDRLMGEEPHENEAPRDERQHEAFVNHLRTGSGETLQAYNSLQMANPTQAGYLVAPERFVADLIAELDNALPFRSLCRRYTLQGAQSLGFPKRTARMNSAAWGTEVSAPTPDNTLAFGKREFKPNPMTAEILLSRTLIANAPQVDGIVRAEMAYDLSELMEEAYMSGDGVDKPLGVFTANDAGISTARDVAADNTATAVTFDGLMNAKYSIKQQYQNKLRWLFHRDAMKMIAKLKDSDGQYLLQPSVTKDAPDMLLGRPVVLSEYAPNTFTTGKYVGLLGDFSNYWICDSEGMEIRVLAELYARNNQIDYLARMSTDGMPVLEECFARVKLA